jgi:hypothetical protein
MPSNDYNLEITTAAYELLHPVYQMLVSKNGSQLDRVINKAYNLKSGDKDLISQVAVFAKTEPGAKDEELFSLLGTEYSDISSELASYYTPYFTNLKTDVIDNQKEVALIPNLQTELIQLQVAINIDDSNATVAYNNSVYWANLGNAYEDNHNYNIYLTDFNKENSAIDKYNQIVVQFNTLGTEYYGSQSLNQIQIIQAKSSQ